MSNPRNAKDALIAEVLGDVEKLQDTVDHLKEVLPTQTDAVEKRLFGVIGLLQKAGDSYQESLKNYTQSQGDTIRVQMEKDAHNARIKFQRDTNEWASQAIANVEKSIKDTLQAEITVPIRKLKAELARSAWKTIILCLGSGLVSGLIVYGGITLTHDPNLEADAHLGRAVASAWPKLDKRSRDIVESEQRK
jgi:hypothetical protein